MLQKRPIIPRSLLIVATPYPLVHVNDVKFWPLKVSGPFQTRTHNLWNMRAGKCGYHIGLFHVGCHTGTLFVQGIIKGSSWNMRAGKCGSSESRNFVIPRTWNGSHFRNALCRADFCWNSVVVLVWIYIRQCRTQLSEIYKGRLWHPTQATIRALYGTLHLLWIYTRQYIREDSGARIGRALYDTLHK